MRAPDLTLAREDGTVYLNRWHVIPRNRWCNAYLHQFLGSDEDRALHWKQDTGMTLADLQIVKGFAA